MTNATCKMPDFCNRLSPHRAETALNALIRLGIDLNNVEMTAVGEYENYKGEVITQEPAPGTEIGPETKITLDIGRYSAVDFLPYQYFYGLSGISHARSGDWEEEARDFLAPFDSAVLRSEAKIKFLSLLYGMGVIDSEYLKRFLSIFAFSEENLARNNRELLIWSSLMPYFNEWAGNIDFVSRLVEAMFGYPCKITENTPGTFEIPPDLQTRLGKKASQLGQDVVIGRSFKECDSSYEIKICDVAPHDLAEFREGADTFERLKRLITICMPNNLDCRITIIGKRQRAGIGREKQRSFLGISSYAGKSSQVSVT